MVIGGAFLSYAIVHSNHVKCPHCGRDMKYIGNDEAVSHDKNPIFVKHYYKCPHCGKVIII